MNRPLLSICIPTYNRADVLSRTLEKLLTNPDFDPARVEVGVSDNASTDHTAEVVARCPGVKYRRQAENVGADRNFGAALELGTGDYVRLMNDTAGFKPGMLKKMLAAIETERGGGRNLLLVQNFFLYSDDTVLFAGADGLVSELSFYATWILNTGMWREDFERLNDKYRYEKTLFTAMDWLLRLAAEPRETAMTAADFYVIEDMQDKGRYNIFDVFVNRYLFLLREHGIKLWVLEREKYRLFRYFVLPWRKKAEGYKFDTACADRIIWSNYWYEPYFVPLLAGKWILEKMRVRKNL